MTTAATYSRYSSDNQRDTSIEDQERAQDDRAAREAWDLPRALRFGRSQGWRLTPSEVAQALRSAAASGSYIAEPIRIRANETLSNV